ncbi:MAG: hypothetical protein ACE5HK_00675 [Candidatus Methylomirabilales bacterium]
MRDKWFRETLLVLLVSLLPLQVVWGEVKKWGDTGIVSAVTLSSRTIVVEIPRRNQSLTVGAVVLPNAELQADGNKIELADIQVGDRVRIVWSTRADGGVAHKIIVLEQAKK